MAPGIDIEKVKREGLAVDIDRYAREGYYAIPKDDFYRLKMHGICAQRHEGFFMLRMRIPGGWLNPDQMERVALLADKYASGTVHLSTRQNIELHSVKIQDVPTILKSLLEVGITTRSSCGHTFRNIIAGPCSGTCPHELVDVRPWTQAVSRMAVTHSDRYNHRLPKRLNVSFNGCTSCESFAPVNDIGFTAVRDASSKVGFSLHVGGSVGVAPRLGFLLEEFLPLEDTLPALRTVAHLYMTYGDRESPAKGRLKFLVESWGIEKFREEFRKALPGFRGPEEGLSKDLIPEPWPSFEPAGGYVLPAVPEGVRPQWQRGFYRVPVFVPLGEIHHDHFTRLAQWARTGCSGKVLITKEQNLEMHWVPGNRVEELQRLIKMLGHSVEEVNSILDVQACPGTSFCSLAITGSQGAGQSLMEYFRNMKVFADPALRRLRIHVSGCPNSCASHQLADIGFSGASLKVGEDNRFAYQLYLGGHGGPGPEIGTLAKKGVADDMVVPVTDALLSVFRRDRQEGEGFRDYLKRSTVAEVVKKLDELLVQRGLSPITYNRVEVTAWQPVTMASGV